MEEARTLAGKAKKVQETAKVKKDELAQKWADTSQELPLMFEDIQRKVDVLSKAKTLPASITEGKIEEAKANLVSVKDEWTKAGESFTRGNFNDALGIAASLKDKALKIMESLEMSSSDISDTEYEQYKQHRQEVKKAVYTIYLAFIRLKVELIIKNMQKEVELLQEEQIEWLKKAFSEAQKGGQVDIDLLTKLSTERKSELEAKLKSLTQKPIS